MDIREISLESTKDEQNHGSDGRRNDQAGLGGDAWDHVWDEGDETAEEVRDTDGESRDV